jgi:sec-independent protein translocase protein TatC
LIFVITFILGLAFATGIIKLYQIRAPFNLNFVQTMLSETFILIQKVAVFFGLIISLPIITYYLLKPKTKNFEDKKTLILSLAGAFSLFLTGILFAYWITIPVVIYFLIGFNFNLANVNIGISNYISFCLLITLVSGIMFEFPVIIYFLKKINLLKASLFLKYWKHAAIVSVIITTSIISVEIFEIIFYSLVFLLLYLLIVFIAEIFT